MMTQLTIRLIRGSTYTRLYTVIQNTKVFFIKHNEVSRLRIVCSFPNKPFTINFHTG